MQLTNSIKRAPRWAWFTVAGVTAGAVGIKIYRDRAAPAASATDGSGGTQVGTPAYGPSGSPTPVITPPVIIGGTSGDGGATADLATSFIGVFGSSFDTLVSSITGLAAGDQGLAGQAITGLIDQSGNVTNAATSVLMNAGSAPAPNSSSPIIVNIPAPTGGGSPKPPKPPKPDPCKGEFPNSDSHGCYKIACASGHGARKKGRWKLYKNGSETHVSPSC